jgi:hypothetical protein
MKTYVWQVTLLASIRVSAPTKSASEQTLRESLAQLSFVASADERELVVKGMEIEGAVDLVEVSDDGDKFTA